MQNENRLVSEFALRSQTEQELKAKSGVSYLIGAAPAPIAGLSHLTARENRPPPRAIAIASTLVLGFALLCVILTAIGGVSFFSLRSIENLNDAERTSARHAIAIPYRLGKNLASQQAEVFRHLTATNPEEEESHDRIIARMVEGNVSGLIEYEKFAENETEKRLYAEVLQAGKAYRDQTEKLLALSRGQRNSEATAFTFATQIPAYDRYQTALDALLQTEETEGLKFATATTDRIEQAQVIGNILIALAIVIALGTGAVVLRILARLREDKRSLQSEVDEHARAEEALREGEARYRLLVDHAPDAIFVVCDEKIVFANPATLKLLGADRLGQIIGRSASEIVHPDERSEVTRRTSEVAAGRQPLAAERRLVRLDGSAVQVESSVISFVFDGRRAVQVIARDNTQQKSAAEKLNAQEKQYRLLFEDNPTPMWVFEIQSLRILAVNQAAILSYGYSREEFLSLTLRDIRPTEDVAAFVKSVSGPRAPAGDGGEWRHLKKDGTVITAAVYSSPTTFDKKEARIVLAVDRTERAEAERSLRESEANLALAQRVAGVGSWEYHFGPDGRLDQENLIWSEEAYRLFGLSSKCPITTVDFFQLVHPEDRALVGRCFTVFMEGTEPFNTDYRINRPDGSKRVIHAIAEKIFDPQTGNPFKVVGTLLDITERLAAEKQLREAEEKYRSIFDNALEGIFQNTPDGVMISANPALARMLGFESAEELIRGRGDIARQSYVQPAKREEFKRLLEENGVVNNFEYEVRRKDGSPIWISENVRVVRDPAGKTLYYEGSAQEISERKRAEAELLESGQRLSLATESAQIGIWDWNVVTNELVWDAKMYGLYGIQDGDFSGAYDAWQNGLHPDDRKRSEAEIFAAVQGADGFHTEFRVVWPNGEVRDIQAHGVLQHAKDGSPARMIGVNWDITTRKRAEQELAESERRLRFLDDLGDATRALSQPKEIMAAATRLLGLHLGVSRCAYAEVEQDGDRFNVSGDYTNGCASIEGKHHLADFGQRTHSELAAGRTVILANVDAELTPAAADALTALQIKAMIACPLIKEGKLSATMAVHQTTPRPWTSSETILVQEVVERCWSIMTRARGELILRESEEHLRFVIAASNDGIFEHDFVTDVLIWSDRMFEMFGLDRRSFAPSINSFIGLLHPDDRAPFQEAVAEQIARGGRYDAHTRVLRQDGTYGNFLGRGRVVLDAAGKPLRIIGSLADLTSLLHAEKKLLEQADLLNLAHDAIMVRDMDDRIEFWNHGAEILYGWTAKEAHGRLSADFLHHEEPIDIDAAQRVLLSTGVWSGECRHITKEGGTVVVRSRWTLVRDEHGHPKSKLIINTDITAQKKIEEQFLRAQRLESIGTLASGVAHDLNNILVPIMMAAPILRGEMDPAERQKFLDIVEASAQRGADIIKQVLTFARGANGDRILLQPIYLLEEVSKIAGQTFPKSISLRTRYDENIHMLEADPTQLHQVLLNLCINARDAMPAGGELCLAAENFDVDEQYASMTPGASVGSHVMLEVTDNGNGIPKEIIDKIFDPFFTTKSVGQGTGLGLSTVAGIVKSLGGFISVSSKPGRTSFKIFLPAKAAPNTASPLLTNVSVPRGNGQTVLLVDDEVSIRELAEIILSSHGYKVLVAEDGPTALALFAQQIGAVDVVVTDLAMPGMDGLMLVRTLRRMEPRLKIIVSTGRAEDTNDGELTALKVDGLLTKPYTNRNLLLKLNHVLQGVMQDAA